MLLRNDSLERLLSYEITCLIRNHSYIFATLIYLPILTSLENDRSVYFDNFARDLISITIYDNTIVNSITINKLHPERVSLEYAENITKFIEELKYNIPPEQAKPIQNSLYEFTNEVEAIDPDEKVSIIKQKNINSKFSIFSKKTLYILPKTAETVSAFRRLTRSSKLTGKGT